jgi:hypothetical protein
MIASRFGQRICGHAYRCLIYPVTPRLLRCIAATSLTSDSIQYLDNMHLTKIGSEGLPDGSVVKNLEGDIVKPWLDERRPLQLRIKDILDAPSLHPADLIHPKMEELLKECCMLGTLQGLQFGQDIVDRLLVEKRRFHVLDYKVFVPERLLRILLYGYATVASKEVVAQSRMREILQQGIDEGKVDRAFLQKFDPPITKRMASEIFPTTNFFNTYLLGLGNAARMTPQAALDSEAVLHQMVELNRSLEWHTKPNTRSYTHVIVAYSNTGHVAAGRRAYKILETMKSVHAAEKEVYETKYGIPYNYKNPTQNKYRIVTPDAAAYTATLNALRISNRSEELAMDLLSEAINADGVRLDAILFVVAIRSMGTIIEAEGNAIKRLDMANEAEGILRSMIQYSQTGGFQKAHAQFDNENSNEYKTTMPPELSNEEDVATSLVSTSNEADTRKSLEIGYNACLHAWAKAFCFEAAPHCEKLLDEMIHSDLVKPSTTSFNTCLYGKCDWNPTVVALSNRDSEFPTLTCYSLCSAWTKSHRFNPNAGKRAIELLNRQFQLSAPDKLGDDVKPDFQSYTSCILAQSKSSDENRLLNALGLLNELLENVANGNLAVTRQPSAPFSAVLTTIALFRPPETATYNESPSNSDAFSSAVNTDSDPYSIAVTIFDQIQNDTHKFGTEVDHHSITAFLKCVAAHTVPGSTERDHTARRVFEDACHAGQASKAVLREFSNVLGAQQAFAAIPDLRNPPKFWSRAVPAYFR